MGHEQQGEAVRHRSFFRTRAFWGGSVLWLAVLAVIAWGWYRTRAELSESGSEARVVQPDVSDSEPKKIVIKTAKDGSLSVTSPSEVDAASPWDKEGIADFAFVDTEGKTVTKSDLLGKPWVVCFVFTHCGLTCPTVTNSMRELQDQLKDHDFRLVSLTVDPERDTAEVLKQYGKDRGADFSRWSFLRGDQREIYRLIHGSFKMPVQELQGPRRQPGFEFIHSNNIMLVDEHGVVQGKFDATKGPAMSALRRELQKLAKPIRGPAEEASKSPS